MHPLPAKKIIKILLAHGFILSRQKGSHFIFREPRTGTMVPIPLHGGNKPLPIGTFLNIVTQSKIPKEKFE
jgi:predicted RNA binding protein YcfA (HicA-like mRNA interferase family)